MRIGIFEELEKKLYKKLSKNPGRVYFGVYFG